jgi:hypothetical protein
MRAAFTRVVIKLDRANGVLGIAGVALLLVSCGSAGAVSPPTFAASSRESQLPEAPRASAAPVEPAPPTWSQVYGRYLAVDSAASCARSVACHASQMGDASSAYEWLRQRGYIDGTQSSLVRSNSCLRWFGGNMPPRGADDPRAVVDLRAWVAAGAVQD